MIETVKDLIRELENHDPEARLRMVKFGGYTATELTIARVGARSDEGVETVYIASVGSGRQHNDLDPEVWVAMGGNRW